MKLIAWYEKLKQKSPNRHVLGMVAMMMLFMAEPAYAKKLSDMDVSEVMINLKNIIQPLISLMLAISFCAGIGFIFKALALMKKFGMHITQMSQSGEISGPLVYLFVGAMLIYLPSTTNVLLESFFGGGNYVGVVSRDEFEALGTGAELLTYAELSSTEEWTQLANTLVLYIQFIGFLAFIRGWFIVARAGQPGVQPGSISKGVTHIVGGVIAINFVEVVKIINTTLTG